MTDAQKSPMHLILAAPRGFCAGVVRAIDIVEKALERYGKPVSKPAVKLVKPSTPGGRLDGR